MRLCVESEWCIAKIGRMVAWNARDPHYGHQTDVERTAHKIGMYTLIDMMTKSALMRKWRHSLCINFFILYSAALHLSLFGFTLAADYVLFPRIFILCTIRVLLQYLDKYLYIYLGVCWNRRWRRNSTSSWAERFFVSAFLGILYESLFTLLPKTQLFSVLDVFCCCCYLSVSHRLNCKCKFSTHSFAQFIIHWHNESNSLFGRKLIVFPLFVFVPFRIFVLCNSKQLKNTHKTQILIHNFYIVLVFLNTKKSIRVWRAFYSNICWYCVIELIN